MNKQASPKMYNIAPGISITILEDGSGLLYIEGQETSGITTEQVKNIMQHHPEVKDETTKSEEFYNKSANKISRLKKVAMKYDYIVVTVKGKETKVDSSFELTKLLKENFSDYNLQSTQTKGKDCVHTDNIWYDGKIVGDIKYILEGSDQ